MAQQQVHAILPGGSHVGSHSKGTNTAWLKGRGRSAEQQPEGTGRKLNWTFPGHINTHLNTRICYCMYEGMYAHVCARVSACASSTCVLMHLTAQTFTCSRNIPHHTTETPLGLRIIIFSIEKQLSSSTVVIWLYLVLT